MFNFLKSGYHMLNKLKLLVSTYFTLFVKEVCDLGKMFNTFFCIFFFQFSPLVQDTVLKGTFNATLNNPIAPQLDMSQHMGTSTKHAFLLGVWTKKYYIEENIDQSERLKQNKDMKHQKCFKPEFKCA